MTEEEAKTKWCPFVRIPEWVVEGADRRTPVTAVNANVDGHRLAEPLCCIASACMAWRWESESYEQRHTVVKGVRRSITHGHCGLAGADK